MRELLNPHIWEKSRPASQAWKTAKREHIQAIRVFYKAEQELMIAAHICLQSSVTEAIQKVVAATLNALFDDECIPEIVIDEQKIGKFPKRFLNAKEKYNNALMRLDETQQRQTDAELQFKSILVEVLREDYNFTFGEVAELFGMVQSTLWKYNKIGNELRAAFTDPTHEADKSN